jgi:hypothetical protein
MRPKFAMLVLAAASIFAGTAIAKKAPKVPTAKISKLDCDLTDILYQFPGDQQWSAQYVYAVGTKYEVQTPYYFYVTGPGFSQPYLLAGSNGLGNTSLVEVDSNAEIVEEAEDAKTVTLHQFGVNKKGQLVLLPNPPQVDDDQLPSMLFLPDLASKYHYDGVLLEGKSEKERVAMPRGPMIGKCLDTSSAEDR